MVIIGHVIAADEPTVEHCYKISEHQDRCFKAISGGNNRMSWPAARDWCNSQNDGYVLATIRDDATQEALVSFLTDNELTSSSVWIGARQRINQHWRWLDGTVEPGRHKLFPVVKLQWRSPRDWSPRSIEDKKIKFLS